MGEDEIDFKPDLDENATDRVAATSSLAISLVPVIGPIIADVLKRSIPNQRIDRMADMLKVLDERLSGMQQEVLEQRMQAEEFQDLLEDGLWQSTRALSEGRRAAIAALLKNSITKDDLAYEQEKTLLSLLGQLNDSELITLGWYGSGPVYMGQRDEYRERHEDVLRIPPLETMMSDEDYQDIALKEAYRDKLRRLGLAEPLQRGRDKITVLGRLLLEQIDFYALEDPQQSP